MPRFVRVAGDNGLKSGGDGIEVEVLDVVEHIEGGDLADPKHLRFWERLSPGSRVNVAAYRGNRR